MNAAMGDSPAQPHLVGYAVNINIAGVGIHVIPAIEPRLQALEPKDAMDNGCLRQGWMIVQSNAEVSSGAPRQCLFQQPISTARGPGTGEAHWW